MRRTLLIGSCLLLAIALWVGPGVPAGAAGTVTGVAPASGDAGTSFPITVTGQGFTGASRVVFDDAGIAVSEIAVVNSTTITARVAIDAGTSRGVHSVFVIEPDQTQAACAGCFTVTGIELRSISPAQVPRGDNTVLTLTGTKFTPEAKVFTNEPKAVVISQTYVSPTTMRATISVAKDMPVPRLSGVGVVLPTGAFGSCECFTFVGTPVTITSITPSRVRRVNGPQTVTIRGTGFVDHFALNAGFFHPSQSPFDTATPILLWSRRFVSPSEIVVEIGVNERAPLGAYDVSVANFDGGGANCVACFVVGRSGYWMVESGGGVHAFGDASNQGSRLGTVVVDIEPAGGSGSYWLVDRAGAVTTHGVGARLLGSLGAGALRRNEDVTSMSSLPGADGYWLFTTQGRAFAFGAARHLGDMGGTRLNGPVLDSVATPSGNGYFMVASDGGIFAFGDARFTGSMGGRPLNAPVQSLVPDRDGAGYWLVASDGGVFAFDAAFRGSMGGQHLNRPVTGMVRYGNGYLMVAADGGIFNFSDVPFLGSLGASPPPSPVVAVAALE